MNDARVRPLKPASVLAQDVPPPPSVGADAGFSGKTETAIRAVMALEAKLAEQSATLHQLKLALLRRLVLPRGESCSIDDLRERMGSALRRLERPEKRTRERK